MTSEAPAPKKPAIALTNGSRIRIRSAGTRDDALVSTGAFRGLVSVGGDNSIAIELSEGAKEEKGLIRLIPLNAVLAIDVLEAAKPEEEKRADPAASQAYFR
jgi:hypothetical protein